MSRPIHLSELRLSAFRGIERELALQFGHRLTIIYGGNATGKSSIAQAIEFAISGLVRDSSEGVIPSQYITNTRSSKPGAVSLTLSNGSILSSRADEPRTAIESRFRAATDVDWPDRQPLPLTTTHLTSQGMLANVLASAHALTKHDLSGLCAGAYLHSLVARAEKLSDHFRQASSGRNMQTALRDARAAFDTARLLYDAVASVSQIEEIRAEDVEAQRLSLSVALGLEAQASVDALQAAVETALNGTEQRLQAVPSTFRTSNALECLALRVSFPLGEDVRGETHFVTVNELRAVLAQPNAVRRINSIVLGLDAIVSGTSWRCGSDVCGYTDSHSSVVLTCRASC